MPEVRAVYYDAWDYAKSCMLDGMSRKDACMKAALFYGLSAVEKNELNADLANGI